MVAPGLLALGSVLAHPGHPEALRFLDGVAHPVMGIDHLVAMVVVGALASLRFTKRPLLLPLAFTAALTLGASLSSVLPRSAAFVEPMVATSLLVFGALLAIGSKRVGFLALPLVLLFGAFHGAAHASATSGLTPGFLAGMILTSLSLHLAGVGIGSVLSDRSSTRRAAALATCALGLFLLITG